MCRMAAGGPVAYPAPMRSHMLLVSCVLLALAKAVGADDIDSRAAAIAHGVMSPYCPQLTLSACRSDAAADLRADIRASLARGATEDEVREGLVRRFGEAVLAAPPTHGFGLFAWTLPPLAVLAGSTLLAVRMLGRRRAAPIGPPAIDDDLRRRLDAELRR